MSDPNDALKDLALELLRKERDELKEEVEKLRFIKVKPYNIGFVTTKEAQKQIESLTKERDALINTLNDWKHAHKILEVENAELKDKVATSMDLLKDWDDDCADLQKKLAASEKARKDAEEKVERYEKDFESLKNFYKRKE